MLPDPLRIEKYLYIRKTPTWKVRLLYLFGIVSWLLIIYSYLGIMLVDPFYTWFVTPILALLTIYHLASFGLNLYYRKFDLDEHLEKVKNYIHEPWVDIFLPVCGEDMKVLSNTWEHVSKLKYKNKKVYVLDDSKEGIEGHRALAEKFGFTFFDRPNKGMMKKAGNLKYAFERSKGEFIAIFDADFSPHPDFILETIPYTLDSKVGIVQTPQYFDTTNETYKSSPLAYNAAYAEEPFYRFIQVTRNRFGGSICCGSNAVYRRSALEAIGGPYQIDYSEDAHTGFAITKEGFKVLYIPVILAMGLTPDNYFAFFHQQHRWSMGSMRLMLSKQFWKAKISWKIKFCYITGFMFYLHHPLILIFPLQLFWTLYFYNEFIPQGSSLLFYPHLLFAIVYLWFFPIAKLRLGYFVILLARTYAYSHAVKSALLRKTVGWVSTNAKHNSISQAFRETINFINVYIFIYLMLILLGVRSGDIRFIDYRYLSVQFWIFWNFGVNVVLLLKLHTTMKLIGNTPKT
jgi:cellulose synthase (UDP-forming)